MVTRADWYARVNAAWPEAVPALTEQEAIRAARKLYRFHTGKALALPVEPTSGNRYTWSRHGTLYVNAGAGWKRMVHDMSHWLHRNSGLAPHDKAHAKLELRLIRVVIARGWLEGKLRDVEKTPTREASDPRAVRFARVLARIERWEKKLTRAQHALRKLEKTRRYYERTLP